MASWAYADDALAPLDDKQEALLKLFLPSLNAPHAVAIPQKSPDLTPVQSIAVMGTQVDTQLVIRLPRKPYYELSSDSSHQLLTLTLDDIDPQSSLPQATIDNTAIQKMVLNLTPSHQLVVTLLLTPNADVTGLNVIGSQPAELVLDVGTVVMPNSNTSTAHSKNMRTPGPYQPLVKKMEPLSPDDTLETQIEKAVNLLNENKPSQALRLLKSTRLLPDINTHDDYYAVLAEANRQSGEILTAVKIYQQLLTHNPNNAVYWAGLGMCFDMLKQTDAAHEAYVKANNLGNLSPSLSQYITQQLTKGA